MRESSHCRPPAHRASSCSLFGLLAGRKWPLEAAGEACPVNLSFSVPMQGPMGPRGPPGPAGAPVSIGSFSLGIISDACQVL